MFEQALLTSLNDTGSWQKLDRQIRTGQFPALVSGMPAGQRELALWALWRQHRRPLLIIVPHDVQAASLAADLSLRDDWTVMAFPARPVSFDPSATLSREMAERRIGVLDRALAGQVDVIVASVEALMVPLPPVRAFEGARIVLKVGRQISREKVVDALSAAGYIRETRVESPGQFAARGDLVDVYPVAQEQAVRIEFFGDEIDGIRRFDADTQRSLGQMEDVLLGPATEAPLTDADLAEGVARLRAQMEARLKVLGHAAQPAPIPGWGALPEQPPQVRLKAWVEQVIERMVTHQECEGAEDLLPLFYPQPDTVAEYMKHPLILVDEPNRCLERSENLLTEHAIAFTEQLAKGQALPFQQQMHIDLTDILRRLETGDLIVFQQLNQTLPVTPRSTAHFEGHAMHVFRGQFDLLRADVNRWRETRCQVAVLAGGERRAQRVLEALAEYGIRASVMTADRPIAPAEVAVLPVSIGQGYECPDSRMVVIGARELFGAARRQGKAVRRRQSADLLAGLTSGDRVVHETHGIGIFEDVVKLVTDGCTRDYLKIRYRDEDVLYIPTEQMDRVQKYVGNDDSPPPLSRLGGREWGRAKSRAKAQIAEMADDLIKLYAQRQTAIGHAYGKDTQWQRQFEDEFPWQETPDQLSAIEEIKADMESPRIMDRLLCGDVGYGKTEVALRAVFKAVMDKKQVALLAPTTILAHQHYATMRKRFQNYGIETAVLSRFRSPAQVQQTLAGLAEGHVDVVVGTHRLLSEDVRFKDLGLLVVDEEQRFGVAHKERIKAMKQNIDVLTLTATPIPRTLHMSMVGIRDISVIDTPPEERYPVQTFVMEFDEGMIRDAILRELGRQGQVFFVYNRVETIDAMAGRLRELVPEARLAVGHGQMSEHKLEQTMLDFMEGQYDLLLSTTIIENGLDIPRVNTLIVYDADRLGLSQLYQLRGRVGRSNRVAYAYLTWRREKALSEVAEKRLEAIREFTEFGSGFRIALRDMEIRGAGNLLGAQQHGHISAVGYGLYCKLIEEAVRGLKGETAVEDVEATIDVSMDAYLPEEYVPSAEDRMEIYRRIAAVGDEDARRDVVDELIDRFGQPPAPVLGLLDVATLRHRAARAGMAAVRRNGTEWLLRFAPVTRVDPVQLLAVLSRWSGRAVLSAGESPSLRLSIARDDEGLEAVGELLIAVAGCMTEPENMAAADTAG